MPEHELVVQDRQTVVLPGQHCTLLGAQTNKLTILKVLQFTSQTLRSGGFHIVWTFSVAMLCLCGPCLCTNATASVVLMLLRMLRDTIVNIDILMC